MNATALASTGMVLVIATWAHYLSAIPRGRVPVLPLGAIFAQLLGSGLALAGLASAGPSWPPFSALAPASVALMLGPMFLWLLTQRKTPVGRIAVKVGDTLPSFSVTASDGQAFNTESLAGQRVLLKFFRGGW